MQQARRLNIDMNRRGNLIQFANLVVLEISLHEWNSFPQFIYIFNAAQQQPSLGIRIQKSVIWIPLLSSGYFINEWTHSHNEFAYNDQIFSIAIKKHIYVVCR